MGRPPTGDHGRDAAPTKLAPVGVVVVGAVGDQGVGAPSGSAHLARHGRHGVGERDQLGDVVAVAAGQRERERDALGVADEVVLGARPAAVDRARARFGAPFFAWTWLESAIARDQSSLSALRNRASKSR